MSIKRKVSNSEDLQKAMHELETRVKYQEVEIKQNFQKVKENLQPTRIMKNTFSYVAETPEIQKILVNTVIGFILGYASKKAVQLLSEDVLDRTVHNLVSHQISKIEKKKPESLLAKGVSLLRKHTPHDFPIYPFVRYN